MTSKVSNQQPMNHSLERLSTSVSGEDLTNFLPFHSSSGMEEDKIVVKIPKTSIPRNAVCLRGKAKKNAELFCSNRRRIQRRELYKKNNKCLSKEITIKVVKKTFLLNTGKVATCTGVGVGIGAVGFATPAAPIAGPVGMAVGGGLGLGVGLYWASRSVKKKVNVTIEKSNEFALWRLNQFNDKVYFVFRNFLDTEKCFKKFICPIIGDLILMPMKAPDGHVYDWEYIEPYIDALTTDPNEAVPSPIENGKEFCKNDLVFDRKFCLDLIKKAEATYNKVLGIQAEHIKAEGLQAVIKNTKHVMEFIREQVEVSVYQELQPKVDSGEITEAERNEMVEKACRQWDFRRE